MITLEQIRGARAMLDLKQHDLAAKAGISIGTLNNIERGVQTDPKLSTLKAIQQALEAEGIQFTEPEMGVYGVQLKPRNKNISNIPLLIIDDNPMDRKLYKAWLGNEDKKYKISEAGNAKDGYEAFMKTMPACIVLDFMMYGKDGFQLLIEMKREQAHMPPIVFVTAMHSDVIKKEALDFGVHSYLDKKTMTKERLCEAVATAVA